jgi:hypothetical protein
MSQSQLHGFTLGVAVASYRDEAHLARTLDAANQALIEAGLTPVARVLVAAEHSAAAEQRAQERGWTYRRGLPGSPRTRAAAREAARRAAGGTATLVIDGDVAIEPGLVGPALAVLAEREGLAGVGGRIDEAHWRAGALVGTRRDVEGAGAGGPVQRLRDVALWRREAVDAVGGYDVWLPAGDDEELSGRLRMAGYGSVTLDVRAGVRHGLARDSGAEFMARLKGGELNGPGIVLRRSRGTMAFGDHLRRSTGRLALVAWLVVGVVATIAGGTWGLGMIWAYVTAGALAFFAVLRMSLPRAFWRGLTSAVEGFGIVRILLLPVALPRVGTPPRPIAPPRETAAEGRESRDEPRPHERDPDEPPPIVRRA